MEVKLLRITEEPVMAIEQAASTCYDSEPSPEGKTMNFCLKSGHTSVLEHTYFTFEISGVSRALLAQITRHRIASFSVRSQRYCSEDGFGYVVPKTIKDNAAASTIYEKTMERIRNNYKVLQELGIPNEDARMILPNACETVIVMSMNLRSLMNFFNERLCTCAQWEIRECALKMKKCIVDKEPKFAPMCVPKCEKHGKDMAFCLESKKRNDECKRHPRLADIFEDYHKYQDMKES